MTSSAYKQCERCVMDTSDPDISFDAAGHCNHCTEFLARRATLINASGVEKFEQAIQRMKRAGESKQYDCVIGVSGGLDSCYAAYVAKAHGLRPLAVHMDNGWNSDIAVRNIKNLAEKLGIDYTSYVLEWDEFRDLQVSFLKASVPEIETPTDMAIVGALHQVAAEHGIKHVISGGNNTTEGILPKAWHYDAKDLRYLKSVHARFGTRPLRSFPAFGFWQEAKFKLQDGIRIVYLLNNLQYRKQDALKLLREDFGWKDYGGKHHESKYTAFVQSYVLPTKFNFDYRRASLSTQICVGGMTRADALEVLKQQPYNAAAIDADKAYIAKKLGMTVVELEKILSLPAKTHRDYPNDQRFLETVYDAYRRLVEIRSRF